MNFIKKNYIVIIFAILIVVIIGLAVKVIHSTPLQPVNTDREYLKEKIKSDSLMLIDITANYIRFKELAESKQKVVIKYKYIYEKKQDSIYLLDSIHTIKYFNEWTSRPVLR